MTFTNWTMLVALEKNELENPSVSIGLFGIFVQKKIRHKKKIFGVLFQQSSAPKKLSSESSTEEIKTAVLEKSENEYDQHLLALKTLY